MNKLQTIIDTVFLGGTVAKLKAALKDATLKMLQAQEDKSQMEDALLSSHDMRLDLESRIVDLNRELEQAYNMPMNKKIKGGSNE